MKTAAPFQARAEVEGKEAGARACERDRDDEEELVVVDGDGVDFKKIAAIAAIAPASPAMLSSRLKAFVIATNQEPAGERRERAVVDRLFF